MVKKYVTHCVFIRCFWSVITFERGSDPMNSLVEALTLLLLLRLIEASIPPVVYPCVNTISAAALDELHQFFGGDSGNDPALLAVLQMLYQAHNLSSLEGPLPLLRDPWQRVLRRFGPSLPLQVQAACTTLTAR